MSCETRLHPADTASDESLLAHYVHHGSHDALRTLVERHARWVHAVAYRRLGNAHDAQDATQAVFILLCRRARHILRERHLAGWLIKTAQYTAGAMLRAQRRRNHHERMAALQRHDLVESPELLVPDLDAAVSRLTAEDQSAIVLRFYQGLEFADVAARLGTTSEGARKRVSRALAKLRRGLGLPLSAPSVATTVACGAPALGADYAAQIAHATLSVAGGAAATASVSAATKGAIFLMAATKTKLAVAGLLAVVLATATISIAVRHAPETPPPAAETPPPSEADTFALIYGLPEGESFRRIKPPFSEARLEFLLARGGVDKESPDGPTAMIVVWSGTTPARYGYSNDSAYRAELLLTSLLNLSTFEIEGPPELRLMLLPGDFAIRLGAPPEAYNDAIAKEMSQAAEAPVTISLQDVQRPVTVLRGQWKYSPADGQAGPDPIIDFYGQDLNAIRRPNAGQAVDGEGFARALSSWIGKQVVVEADGIPAHLRWRPNLQGLGTDDSRALARDPEHVLKHVEEQTGLTIAIEQRTVRRLLISRKP